MKRRIKGLFTLFLTVAAIMLTALALTSGASAAAGKLDYKITYGEDGAATLKVIPRVDRNYITFTTDGTKPTYTSDLFPASVTVRNEPLSLRLAEYNIDNEYLWGIKLTVKPRVTKVNIKEEYYTNSTNVTLSCDTEGAKIYYTLDGSTPTTSSKRYFDGFIRVTEKSYLKAMAVKSGYKNSNVVTKKILVKDRVDSYANKTEDLDDDAIVSGTKIKYSASYHAESAATYITLAPQKSSNKIYYTLDGSAPSKNSKLYTKKLKFTRIKTLRAVEYTPTGKVAATLKYNVKLRCKEVELTAADIADGTCVVKMTCPTEGASIYYTVNGKAPNEKSIKYTEPFMIGHTTKLKAIAIKDGYVDSAVKTQIGIDIPLDLSDFNYMDSKYTNVVDKLSELFIWYGYGQLEYDEKTARAAQKRAIELEVRMSDERPNGNGWSSVFAEDKIYPKRGFEVIGKNKPINKLIDETINHSLLKEFKFDHIGVGYYESKDGDYYWAIVIVDC